ncbi:MAG: hypothetical protein ACC619_04990, partial [Paracoccaceae bacterium]
SEARAADSATASRGASDSSNPITSRHIIDCDKVPSLVWPMVFSQYQIRVPFEAPQVKKNGGKVIA